MLFTTKLRVFGAHGNTGQGFARPAGSVKDSTSSAAWDSWSRGRAGQLGDLSGYLCWHAAACTADVLGSESHRPAQHFPKSQDLFLQ